MGRGWAQGNRAQTPAQTPVYSTLAISLVMVCVHQLPHAYYNENFITKLNVDVSHVLLRLSLSGCVAHRQLASVGGLPSVSSTRDNHDNA